MSPKAVEETKPKRQPITRTALEHAIADAVRVNSDCPGFVGVVVDHVVPVPAAGANWTVKGVKYGKCNREVCAASLDACVTEKQLKFDLAD